MPLSSAQGNYFPKMIGGLASFEVQSRDFFFRPEDPEAAADHLFELPQPVEIEVKWR